MEPKGSVTNPIEPATGHYSKPEESNTLFCLKIYFKMILPLICWSSNYAFSRRLCLIHALVSFFLGLLKNLWSFSLRKYIKFHGIFFLLGEIK
jgi:hypothetical protein